MELEPRPGVWSHPSIQLSQQLITLLRRPDTKQILKNCRPLFRSPENIEIIEEGRATRYKWEGAIPSRIRNHSLNLTFISPTASRASQAGNPIHYVTCTTNPNQFYTQFKIQETMTLPPSLPPFPPPLPSQTEEEHRRQFNLAVSSTAFMKSPSLLQSFARGDTAAAKIRSTSAYSSIDSSSPGKKGMGTGKGKGKKRSDDKNTSSSFSSSEQVTSKASRLRQHLALPSSSQPTTPSLLYEPTIDYQQKRDSRQLGESAAATSFGKKGGVKSAISTPIYNKRAFSVNDNQEFLDEVESTKRHTTNNINTNAHDKESFGQPSDKKPKTFSIKYIGVHNDMMGVLSRKFPLETIQPSPKAFGRKSSVNSSERAAISSNVFSILHTKQEAEDGRRLQNKMSVDTTNEEEAGTAASLKPRNVNASPRKVASGKAICGFYGVPIVVVGDSNVNESGFNTRKYRRHSFVSHTSSTLEQGNEQRSQAIEQQRLQQPLNTQQLLMLRDMPQPEKYDRFVVTKYSLERKLKPLRIPRILDNSTVFSF